MFIAVAGSGCRGRESIEDQVSADINDVVQASKSDLMARGVAIDLLQMAKEVGSQREAAEHKNLSGEEGSSLTALSTIEGAIEHFVGDTSELSMKAPMSVLKPADLG